MEAAIACSGGCGRIVVAGSVLIDQFLDVLKGDKLILLVVVAVDQLVNVHVVCHLHRGKEIGIVHLAKSGLAVLDLLQAAAQFVQVHRGGVVTVLDQCAALCSLVVVHKHFVVQKGAVVEIEIIVVILVCASDGLRNGQFQIVV